MSPSDKNKTTTTTNSEAAEDTHNQQCQMDSSSTELPSASTSNTTPDPRAITNIPLLTANLPTLKCSINDQMKTFDPGEVSNHERLNNQCGSSLMFPVKNSNSLIKNSNNKNYKAGSKINKLADMLAKRSQNVVEVTSDIISDFSNAPKTDEAASDQSVVKIEEEAISKTVNDKPVDLVTMSRRKSVPNQSCIREELQPNSKSCSDFSELFPDTVKPESNALEESLNNPQTEESTKSKKVIRKNLKNVELSLILPEKKRRSSPRCKKIVTNSSKPIEETTEPVKKSPNNNSSKVKKAKRKLKQLVETSTQTADIEFITVLAPEPEITEQKPQYMCLYCTESFTSGQQCKIHEKTHTQKKKSKQFIKCQYCSKKLPSWNELKSHCGKSHPNKYFYCMKCDERFFEKSQLYNHNKETHLSKIVEEESDETKKMKQNAAKSDLKIDVSFDSVKKSSTSPRIVQKPSPRDNKTEEQLLEMEMLFYSHLSGNIQENLTNHLDGKIDKNGNPVRTDQITDSTEAKSSNLLSVVTPSAGVPVIQVSRAPSPYQTRSKTPNPLPKTAKKFKKLPNWQQKFWEKYNFPTNYRYEHRFWDKNYLNTEKSALYLKDLSCLDIKTQLTMRENIKKLDNIKTNEEATKNSDKLIFPDFLSLIPKPIDLEAPVEKTSGDKSKRKKEDKKSFKSPALELPVKSRRKMSGDLGGRKSDKMMTRRQSVVELGKERQEDSGLRRRKGSLDMTGSQKMTLRRQTSLDSLQNGSRMEENGVDDANSESSVTGTDPEEVYSQMPGAAEISGEWVRPRSYLCGTCCARFTNLWELEDHKWTSHPNVWCTHYEFEDEKIDKLFTKNEDEEEEDKSMMLRLKLTDLYKRYLLPRGALKTARVVPNTNFPEQCTKCKKNCSNASEMHKHMLDCGGDTNWFLTMYSSPTTIKRKWRPFGSRRRKQIGRRMLKRNIPSTPTLRPYQYQHRIRTKPGDVESIQKMLANLPEKRARRAINFDEIKTRSQATIHSNRLLRKRFKVSFGSNFMRLKNLKAAQQRQMKSKKGTSSKSATDTSSETTPIGSPKRRSRLTDSPLNSREVTPSGDSSEGDTRLAKLKASKAISKNKKESPLLVSDIPKKETTKAKKVKKKAEKKKPAKKRNVNPEKDAVSSQLKDAIADVERKVETKKKAAKKKKGSVKVKKEPVVVKSENPVEPIKKKSKNREVEPGVPKTEKLFKTEKANILRLRQNDKEKTELIKRIKKSLRNSKRILEMRESKLLSERRRSQRIKVQEETVEEVKPTSTNNIADVIEEIVRTSSSKSPKIEPAAEVDPTPKRTKTGKGPKPAETSWPETKILDLSEMPILDKEEPIRARTSRKNETDIPVLMPFENGFKENGEVEKPEIEDLVRFKIVKKSRKTSPKKITPLKIVKQVESKAEVIQNGFGKNKRKRKDISQEPVAKNPKVKKYFLGICPNEIDKGGEEEESNSDSEPLITLLDQKFEKPEAEPKVKQETVGLPDVLFEKIITDKLNEVHPEKPGKISKSSKKIKTGENRKKSVNKKPLKGLRMTVTLKEATLKIVEKSPTLPKENKWTLKLPEPELEPEPEVQVDSTEDSKWPERRSRRISKETSKSTNEFIIDDPLLLVDELWSDLDSDSDSSRKRVKKGKKKSPKKRTHDEKKSDVNLEELLRKFGENKEVETPKKPNRTRVTISSLDIRRKIENQQNVLPKSYKRLSLQLFKFNKVTRNFGNRGRKLVKANEKLNNLPKLPFLSAEVTENPVQIIKCGTQKPKSTKKNAKKVVNNIQLKVSLPLECINNLAILNNNHLTEVIVEEPKEPKEEKQTMGTTETTETMETMETMEVAKEPPKETKETKPAKDTKEPKQSKEVKQPKEIKESKEIAPAAEEVAQPEVVEESKNKSRRSEVIDKIFHCEICETYYYSSSQLKIHKSSNRHKLKEAEANAVKEPEVEPPPPPPPLPPPPPPPVTEHVPPEPEVVVPEELKIVESVLTPIEPERLNEDTSEMPILEGPFIENPFIRLGMNRIEPTPKPQPVNSFGFSEDCLKDIQRAIGCTDEEMLILTLLGENSIEIENDILDLDSCKPVKPAEEKSDKPEQATKETEKTNGILKVDLKKRMTSALACLVNKAVFNLLQKSETAAKTPVNPEALSFLNKLSSVSHKKNILQLNELLKKQSFGESSVGGLLKDEEKKDQRVPYKYQCTICGSRFEKASTRECHIIRTHRSKGKKSTGNAAPANPTTTTTATTTTTTVDENQVTTQSEDEPVDWNDTWSYDVNDDVVGGPQASQFWCSDCGINFTSPQEVLEHQKLEHHASQKEPEPIDSGPLQSATIGSSDEIVEGKKPTTAKRRPKHFSYAELDQQRIIANNELRKLDRRFANKNKTNKIKWGMDALKFTVEKESKLTPPTPTPTPPPPPPPAPLQEEKIIVPEEPVKPTVDIKNIDMIPKLNLSRTNNIPEFKVIQKISFENRFQKIIDNKLKRKSTRCDADDVEEEVEEEEIFVAPPKKKEKKRRPNKMASKKSDDSRKVFDVYDFNESESETEPIVLSHVKKATPQPPKLKIKVKEGSEPSKNKADSTTKDLTPDDYDSEDSLPLAVVKKTKADDEEETSEKPEAILEQVEFLIGQLGDDESQARKKKKDEGKPKKKKSNEKDESVESFRISLENKFLQLKDIPLKKIIPEQMDEDEDSIPLMLMSKKPAESSKEDSKETTPDLTALEDSSSKAKDDIFVANTDDMPSLLSCSINRPELKDESLPPLLSTENEDVASEKSYKSDKSGKFDELNGNVIYHRNDSMSEFDSDFSDCGIFDTKTNDSDQTSESFIKEVMEKEDVVIVCSKKEEEEQKSKKKAKKETAEKKKKIIPLLSATIEEDNFRKSESPKLNKEVIVKKIWSRRKVAEDSTENDDNSNTVDSSVQNDDSHTEIEKEMIMKKIWSRKKLDESSEGAAKKKPEKPDDVKINQTEISNEIVIKCGPKTKAAPKRRKSRGSTNEASKDTIMRRIWSGKFQTKAALKTYESDIVPNCKENEASEAPKKRGRASSCVASKRTKLESDAEDEDDLDSLLEEIEREDLEKAIRLEFLQLRRSDKANVENVKENTTVGLFTETCQAQNKDLTDKKRRKIRRNIKLPRKSIIKRKLVKKIVKKPEDNPLIDSKNRLEPDTVSELSENSVEKNSESLDLESKIKNRKHKKHRHKHHHHKHKHKRSKHHKCVVNKHKNKHKFENGKTNESETFSLLEKICQQIPKQIENESIKKKAELDQLDEILMSPFSFENKTKECEDLFFEGRNVEKQSLGDENGGVYEFVEDDDSSEQRKDFKK